ncbi:hypothetical protein J8L98_18795 [Pseudoalteromonas sp. MMG013]|uniref:glycoside hydrolase family protein n=1 Tax=Pseudoalteromonas sp. MMG013 TaxID=2822687 RepID=UPI001B38D928|nr:hypothetical protein [Pseudoalteromonas sp. MMG013]MBQ4863734.1 hypothetical protein [Pseudoalteromonas sp. MMG013]
MAPKNFNFIANLKQFEGQINHLYLDSRGNPTIGIGFMMANIQQFCALTLYTQQHELATKAQKKAEYNRISTLPTGYKAAWYGTHCQLHLSDPQCEAILQKHLTQFEQELSAIFSKKNGYNRPFKALPQPVKYALLDMAFNLGSHHLGQYWPKLHNAIKQQDWHYAAQECHRKHIQKARNDATAQLFLAAKGQQKNSLMRLPRLQWLLNKLRTKKCLR